ncbi:hypothetical protein A5781_00960 [Mycobacterium sp. 852002-30065_SCH5024008]|nr:hypothetical protein A5781_00960 [Mycobacterium sp. 852002-30065_SCH5024008]
MVLPGQHDLDQGVMGQGAGGVQPFHEQLEGQVLVLKGGQATRAHLGKEFGHAGVAGQIDA